MDMWAKSVKEVESLMQDGYTVKVAGIRGKEGWWATKHIPYQNTPSYRIEDSIITQMRANGYTLKETLYSFELIKEK